MIKQLVFRALMLLAVGVGAFTAHAAKVSISNSEIKAGQTDTVRVILSEASDVRGMELTISLPEGLTLVKVTSPISGLSVTHNTTAEGLKVVGFTSSSTPVGSGTVLELVVQATKDVTQNSITINGAVLVGSDQQETDADIGTSVTSITISPHAVTMNVDNTLQLKASVGPEDAADKTVTWSSDKPAVATVSANGVVTAVALGTAIITATSNANPKVKATRKVTVLPRKVTSVTLDVSTASIEQGGTKTLTATIEPDNATDKTVTWSSSDENVATVKDGVVTAVAPGTAIITVTANDKSKQSATCTVTVTSTLTGISLNPSTLSGIPGDEKELTVTYTPANTTSERGITWSSSDDKVATVSESGVVTLVAPGTATITATSKANADFKTTCAVTVNAVPVTKLTLSDTDINVEQNKTVTLTATIEPENATDKTVTWSSSDEKVATVSADGLVTAVAPGTATITATANDKSKQSATCTVTVTSTLTGISLNPSTLSGIPGDKKELTVTYTPANTTSERGITWSSSDDKVATVSESGMVTLVAPGTATITATSKANADFKATCDVTVNAVPVTKLTLSDTDINVEQNKTVTLTATIEPENATDKTVTWSSDKPAVATVKDGLVTAVAPGTATITATVGEKSATCTVTVTSTLTEISLNPSTLSGIPGDKKELTVTYTPANTTSERGITWSSSDDKVATVSESGMVTLVAPGTATITATSKANADFKATCAVTVNAVPATKLTLSDTDINVEQNKTVTLTATIEPENATDKTVTWSSDKPAVATVKDGLVTAVAPGTATITATVGEKSATCTVTVTSTLTGISLNPSALSGIPGDKKELTVTYTPANTTSERGITWSSSDDKVATVSESGVVTLVAPGTVTITATSKANTDFKATCDVTVNAVTVTKLTLSDTDINVEQNKTVTLTATIEPENATDKTVTWSSDKPAVATVKDGVVTAVAPGTATITATAGTISKTCKVTVVILTDGVSLDKNRLEFTFGDEPKQLTATVKPDTATDKTVTWSTGNDKVAIVVDGLVTAVGVGTAIITAEAGGKKAECTVTVKAKLVVEPSTGTGDTPGEPPVITPGESIQLVIKVEPEGAEAPEVTWSSSDTDVATVDSDGKVTPGDKSGTVTITATTPDGETITFEVTVNATEGISLDKTELDLKATETYKLTATLDPSTSKDEVKWSSSVPAVATVKDGVVTAVAPGTAIITVEAGGKKAECTVTVKAKLVVEPSTGTGDTPGEPPVITPGESVQLVIKVEPEGAEAPEVTWSSSDEAIAKVDSDGKVTPGDKSGTVTITATTPDGETITFEVTVNATEGISLDKTELDLKATETYTLTATLDPSTSKDEVKWSSSAPAVAAVVDGVVTAVTPGTAIITVEVGGKKAECTVTVKAKLVVEPSTGTGDTPGEPPVITPGESIQLVIKVEPEGAEAPEVTWSSSDTDVATVDSDGKVTPGDKSGTVTITATTPDGETITFEIEVVIPTGIDDINQDAAVGDLYSINGIIVMKGVTRDEVKGLAPGYYIFRTGTKTEKILVR